MVFESILWKSAINRKIILFKRRKEPAEITLSIRKTAEEIGLEINKNKNNCGNKNNLQVGKQDRTIIKLRKSVYLGIKIKRKTKGLLRVITIPGVSKGF